MINGNSSKQDGVLSTKIPQFPAELEGHAGFSGNRCASLGGTVKLPLWIRFTLSVMIAAGEGSLTVTVSMRIKRRGLRNAMTLPDAGSLDNRPWDSAPTPLQLALARAHRWLAMLESGEVSSMKEIVRREEVDDSYVSRMVTLCNDQLAGSCIPTVISTRRFCARP
jgi:hypothetical protein